MTIEDLPLLPRLLSNGRLARKSRISKFECDTMNRMPPPRFHPRDESILGLGAAPTLIATMKKNIPPPPLKPLTPPEQALFMAALADDAEAVAVARLIADGADIDAVDMIGKTPAIYASEKGQAQSLAAPRI